MVIGDTIAGVLPELQAQAENLMRDVCTISRVTGTTEDGDGREIPDRTVIYGPAVEPHKGKCKVQANQLTDMSPEVGGATVTVQRYRVDIPVSAGPIEVGDLIETRGRQFRVTGLHDKTWQTAQRLPVEEVT